MTDEQWRLVVDNMGLCWWALAKLGGADEALVCDVGLPTLQRCAELWDEQRPFALYAKRALFLEYAKAMRRARRMGARMRPLSDDARALDEAPTLDCRDEVLTIMGRLSRYDRMLLLMRYWGGMTYDDIGQELGVPKPTVADQVRKALRRARALGR